MKDEDDDRFHLMCLTLSIGKHKLQRGNYKLDDLILIHLYVKKDARKSNYLIKYERKWVLQTELNDSFYNCEMLHWYIPRVYTSSGGFGVLNTAFRVFVYSFNSSKTIKHVINKRLTIIEIGVLL